MEEEIDLRQYVRAFRQHWWWVVSLGFAATVLAFVVSSLLPASYEATSTVLVMQPRYQLNFDGRMVTVPDAGVTKSLPTLAASEEVLQSVINAYTPPPEAQITPWTPEGLGARIRAGQGRDPSQFLLRVRTASPQVSAAIANQWIDVVVKKANAIYGDSGEDVTFLESELAQAKQALDEANAAVAQFQSRNPGRAIQAELKAQEEAESDYVSTQFAITNTLRDIQDLRDQLAKRPMSEPVSTADSVTVLLLQVKAFNAGASLPIQVQASGSGSVASMSREEQIALLDNLMKALLSRPADIEAQRAALKPKMQGLQRQLQEAQTEYDNVQRRQNLAEETYMTLARKLDEARIAEKKGNGLFHIGSYARAPQKPASPRPLRDSALGGIMGLMLGIVAVSGATWWKK